MTTAIDSNVIIALWDGDESISRAAQSALDAALGGGPLILAAPVFAELMAAPGRTEAFLDSFFKDTGILVDWTLDEAVWRAAGQAFQAYVARRRKQRDRGPHRILADFLIGAHARRSGYRLLTLDDRFYCSAFPDLVVIRVNQLIHVAVKEKLSALRTEEYFRERAGRASIGRAKRVLKRAGKRKPPVSGDEV